MSVKSGVRHLERLIKDPGLRKDTGQLVISGHHIVNEYSGPITDLYVSDRYIQKHGEPKRPFKMVGEQIIQRITKEGRPEGILALIPCPQNTSGAICHTYQRTLILWELTDPRNIGSLARTALALRWTQLVLFGRADPFHPEAIRCSKGALLCFPRIVRTEDPTVIMDLSKLVKLYLAEKRDRKGGMEDDTERPCVGNIALVLGSESHGLKDLPPSIRNISSPITIDTSTDMPHISVSAAGAILMHRLSQNKPNLL